MEHALPIIAIVGRPNVGKSSLFNRLIGKRIAIESKIAGTTRDRIYRHCEINSLTVVLVDTGGLEYGKKTNIENDIKTQVELAIAEADLIYFVVDAKDELTANDFEAAATLRKSGKKILLIANKTDAQSASLNLPEISKLGFGNPIEISAYHRRGLDNLEDHTEEILKKLGFTKQQHNDSRSDITNICFIGKPNAGKSSLINALLGKPKVIVSETPGTTRDAIDTEITWQNKKFNLIDTAGLRKRGKIERGLEKLSSFRALEAIERSDITCLILDYKAGISNQDQHIASYILEANKGLLLIINKTDLMKSKEQEETKMIHILKRQFVFLPWAPVIFVSALQKTNIEKILEIASKIHEQRFLRIDPDELYSFMKEVTYKHLPPHMGKRLPKFFSLEQSDTNPPTFTYWVNDPTAIHFSYKRYLENELRAKWPFTGTPIKLIFKKQEKKR